MTQLRNFSRNAQPKRTAALTPKPKYGGVMLWGMADHRIKCRDCTRYATHEALVKHEPNPFNPATEAVVSLCVTHGNKGVTKGEVIRIAPYNDYAKHQRDVKKWESQQGAELQGMLM